MQSIDNVALIEPTERVKQVRGMFDLTPEQGSHFSTPKLPKLPDLWNIGLIVGPSGCGKSTIARHYWSPIHHHWGEKSILDYFEPFCTIKKITAALNRVGFSSPPAWLRRYSDLSTGQQMRADLARALTGIESPIVFDEFTSVIDRNIAHICCTAIQKAIRKEDKKFIAVTCHEDVEEHLQPDWVYRPAEQTMSVRRSVQLPQRTLAIFRCSPSAWHLFKHDHYLSESINATATCFMATLKGKPCAFSAWLPFFGNGPKSKREHRTVVLADYQGIGIGNTISNFIASLWSALGFVARSTTTHPGFIQSRNNSPLWEMTRSPQLASVRNDCVKHATTRMTAGFKYVGPAMSSTKAKLLNQCLHR